MPKLANKRTPDAVPARTVAVQPSQSIKSTSQNVQNDKGERGSKQARVIAMLRAPTGTTIAAVMRAIGWQQHSVRGFFAGVVRKKLRLKLSSKKVDGHRIYRIADTDSAHSSRRRPSRRSA
jgi:hypothetical protein